MSEQEATDKLEELVGNVDGCFRLMRIYASLTPGIFYDYQPVSIEKRFFDKAKKEGYSEEAINHYLRWIR